MSKRYFYHGTSADNLPSILRNGLSVSETKLWTCSEDGIYLWDSIDLAKANGRDLEEDADYIEEEAFRMAADSGEIACSMAKDCRLVVVKCLLDENEMNEDCSCPNMEGSGAKVLYRNISIDEIVDIKVSNDLSLLKGYFINLIIGRDYCNVDFDTIETKIAAAFSKAEFYPEDVQDITEWETIPMPILN